MTASVGFATPETTYERALSLNNAFDALEKGATKAGLRDKLMPTITGYAQYFTRLKNSWATQFFESGELDRWQAKYEAARRVLETADPAAAANVPVLVDEPSLSTTAREAAAAASGAGDKVLIGLVLLGVIVFLRGRR